MVISFWEESCRDAHKTKLNLRKRSNENISDSNIKFNRKREMFINNYPGRYFKLIMFSKSTSNVDNLSYKILAESQK